MDHVEQCLRGLRDREFWPEFGVRRVRVLGELLIHSDLGFLPFVGRFPGSDDRHRLRDVHELVVLACTDPQGSGLPGAALRDD